LTISGCSASSDIGAVIACINLPISARAIGKKSQESHRKVIGSSREALIAQFLMESVISLFSLCIGRCSLSSWYYPPSIPWQNAHRHPLPMAGSADHGELCPADGSAGGAAGFYLSSFQPVKCLKGRLPWGVCHPVRKVLWCCSSPVRCADQRTIVVYQQIQFASRPRGYDPNGCHYEAWACPLRPET